MLMAYKVLALVPSEWPLDVVSSFFQRSLRRQLHDRASWQILKAISAGQNLEVRCFLDFLSFASLTHRSDIGAIPR